MHQLKVAVLAFGIASVAAVSALGHHGWSGYDGTKTLNLTGVIRNSGYDNPHSFIDLEVTNETATRVKVWHVVLGPPTEMTAQGISREMLDLGNFVKVMGHPSVTDPNELRAERIIFGSKTIDLKEATAPD